MAQSVTIPSTELVQEFLTAKGKEVIKKMFYGFRSANAVRKFDGVTDTLKLAVQDVTVDLIREWNATVATTDDAIEVTNVDLHVSQMKTELKFIIKEETTRAYKAYLKGAGLVSDDVSLIDYLLMQPMEKMMKELEDAMWQGEQTNSGAGTRTLIDSVDGYRKIAYDAGVASKATVVTTGAITSSNAVSKVETLYQAADKTMKDSGFHIFCSYTLFENYQLNMLSLHNQSDVTLRTIAGQGYTLQGIPLRIGAQQTFLIPVPGMGDDDALIGTRAEFLAYGFDYESEATMWDIQKHGWETWALNSFPVGFQILLQKPGFLLVNDRL